MVAALPASSVFSVPRRSELRDGTLPHGRQRLLVPAGGSVVPASFSIGRRVAADGVRPDGGRPRVPVLPATSVSCLSWQQRPATQPTSLTRGRGKVGVGRGPTQAVTGIQDRAGTKPEAGSSEVTGASWASAPSVVAHRESSRHYPATHPGAILILFLYIHHIQPNPAKQAHAATRRSTLSLLALASREPYTRTLSFDTAPHTYPPCQDKPKFLPRVTTRVFLFLLVACGLWDGCVVGARGSGSGSGGGGARLVLALGRVRDALEALRVRGPAFPLLKASYRPRRWFCVGTT